MVVDFEITLNRFGFYRLTNKVQIAFVRISWWDIPNKHSVSFEINWKNMTKQEMELSQAFTELEYKVKALKMAHDISESLGSQKHSYWIAYIEPVEKRLADFKTKFYKIMLEMEEPE
jgi:hypothetical protein